MIITRIALNNYRIYYGQNELSFSNDGIHNVSVVAGNNGYGKTTLLTALVWGLYGKLMADVDERYRKEIYEPGGYNKYCEKTMNWKAAEESQNSIHQLLEQQKEVNAIEKRKIKQQVRELQTFSVAIQFSRIFIPSLPCHEVIITRTYNVKNHQEDVEILIDGRPNELTKGMDGNIFINDFILPKEIAKFFFFDAERIVSLAEIRTAEEKKALSYAYSEVLGVKKYADLKENLQNLQFRIRNKSSKKEDRAKQNKVSKAKEQNEKMIAHYKGMIEEKRDELNVKKNKVDKLQEQLIREGTALSLDDVKGFKKMQDNLNQQGQDLKARLQDMMELVPFAIAAGKFQQVKDQLEEEYNQNDKKAAGKLLARKAEQIEASVKKSKRKLGLDKEKEALLVSIIQQHLNADSFKNFKILLKFSDEQYNHFNALHANLTNSFSKSFRQITSDMKRQQSSLMQFRRKLQDAESKENDPVIKRIRQDKVKLEQSIKEVEAELIQLEAHVIQQQNELNSNNRVLKELTKTILVEDKDKAKDETSERLIAELTDFIRRLKMRKKTSLESNIQNELNRLMHKRNFISNVEVVIEGDLIDIELYDKKKQLINKEDLSKGEQQLYATALLKALIAESNIHFPVFIDSPLQKFDKEHSRNIIQDFYPHVSEQVILFPLLEKELTEKEYQWLLPHTANVYLIQNSEEYSSTFREIKPAELFETYQQETEYVNEYQDIESQ